MPKTKTDKIAINILSKDSIFNKMPIRILFYWFITLCGIEYISWVSGKNLSIADLAQIGFGLLLFFSVFYLGLRYAATIGTRNRILMACEYIKAENWSSAKNFLIDRQADISDPILKNPIVAYIIGYTLYELNDPNGAVLLQYSKDMEPKLQEISIESETSYTIAQKLINMILDEKPFQNLFNKKTKANN